MGYYWQYMLRGHDVDRDGKIDKPEFMAFVKQDLHIDQHGRLDRDVEAAIRRKVAAETDKLREAVRPISPASFRFSRIFSVFPDISVV